MKQFRSLVFLDEGVRLLERGETVEKEYLQNFENRMEKGQIQKNQKKEIFSCTEILHLRTVCAERPCDTGKF